MSKGLIKMAEGFELIAAGLRQMALEGGEPVKAVKEDKKAKKDTVKKESEVTVETVRLILADKSRDGKTQEVRALLNKFGADKLSAIPEEKLVNLLQEAEAL